MQHCFSLTHLSDDVLLQELAILVRNERATIAAMLAHIAEVDARRLWVPKAYASMAEYCVRELGLSKDATFKRTQAARTARDFPVIFEMLADGRLHLTGVNLLATCLTRENAESLLASAAGKSKAEIERLIAERFPATELLPLVSVQETTPEHLVAPAQLNAKTASGECTSATASPVQHMQPLAGRRYPQDLTIAQSTYDKLQYARSLEGHSRAGDPLGQLFDRALDAYIARLEKRKFGATARPQRRRRTTRSARHIPADVKRTVWKRDGGRCTFTSDDGRRCECRRGLEYDHIILLVRGGESTVDNLRMRCRAHNQYAAEQVLGAAFMAAKREAAQREREDERRARERERRAAAERKAAAAAAKAAHAARLAALADVIAALRQLGYRREQAEPAALASETLGPEATTEQQLKYALGRLLPAHLKPRSEPHAHVVCAAPA